MIDSEFQNEDNFFKKLEEKGIHIDPSRKNRIRNRIKNVLSYQPKVGILGQTGAGKSSMCNALFDKKLMEISHTKAQTREIQQELLSVAGDDKGIIVVDVPGLGESRERDQEYFELYNNLIPELDIVIWLLKADDRAYEVDIRFYKEYLKDLGKPVIYVLSQVEKIEPMDDWDTENGQPGLQQMNTILEKQADVEVRFNFRKEKIIPVSASKKFNLIELVDEIIFSLPNDKKITVLKDVEKENISEEAKQDAIKGFTEEVFEELAGQLGELFLGRKGQEWGRSIGAEIGRAVDDIFDWIKGWF